jgi:HEAT repeat protein
VPSAKEQPSPPPPPKQPAAEPKLEKGIPAKKGPAPQSPQPPPVAQGEKTQPPRKATPKSEEALKPVLDALKSKKPQDRLQAVEKVAELGEQARPALRALSEVMVGDPVAAVRQSALAALEKVHPEMYKSVVALLVESDSSKHVPAARGLAGLGDEGRGAVPVLLAHIKGAVAKYPQEAPDLITEDIQALAKIAPDDLAVQKMILELTLFTVRSPFGRSQDIGHPTRVAAIRIIGEIAQGHPEQARNLTPGLIKATRTMSDAEARGQAVALLGTIGEGHEELRSQIAPALTAFLKSGEFHAIPSLAQCGRAAKDAAPLLRQLKLHPDEAVRVSATDALARIEDALTDTGTARRPNTPPRDVTHEKGKSLDPQPADVDLPRELQPLVARLRTGATAERVKAAEELAALGDKGAPAARALCEAALHPISKVSRSALKALEAINPDLHQPVFVLVVDDKAANHLQAITKLGLLGDQAKPALPVVLHQIKKCEEQLISTRSGWAQPTLITVTLDLIKALPKIAPEDPSVLRTMLEATKFSMPRDVFIQTRSHVRVTRTPFRDEGIQLLGDLVEAAPNHQKQVVPQLLPLLKEAVQRTTSTQDQEVLQAIQEVDEIVTALLKCGEQARTALTREVAPRLRDLQFHRSDRVRSTAEALSKRVQESQ